MLTPKEFDEQAAELASANHLSTELASKYAALIGDTPELDDQGKVIVRDENGFELARLSFPEEASSPA